MKLIIDIPDVAYEAYKEWHKNKVATVEQSLIANGIPYEEKPQGEWVRQYGKSYKLITTDEGTLIGEFTKCPKCLYDKARGSNFCPNCGADMRKGGAE